MCGPSGYDCENRPFEQMVEDSYCPEDDSWWCPKPDLDEYPALCVGDNMGIVEWSSCYSWTSLDLHEMRAQLTGYGLEKESILCEQVLLEAQGDDGIWDSVAEFFTEKDMGDVEWDLTIMKECLDEQIHWVSDGRGIVERR